MLELAVFIIALAAEFIPTSDMQDCLNAGNSQATCETLENASGE